MPSNIDDTVEDEVILGESVSEGKRRVRVYDGDGDFVIEVPEGAKITFGYFNPASAGQNARGDLYGSGGAVHTMRTTALRIYEKGERGNQLACFLGVRGFRDEAVKKTSLVQRVVVERRYENDGEGSEKWGGSAQHELVAAPEEF